ncbi:methylthioribulose-1-phosphate dehydratase [Stagonosporopsis vannaccii]|nr:methylthioribulose-1-phosphate dehydratase [Stagonosporopsis vannaccii]
MAANPQDAEALIHSDDPHHPANHICTLCAHFYTLGWVTGTGGGTSIRHEDKIYIAPSGVQKELMKPTDMFVLKPSACTPLFMAAFERGAGCCIHTHSQWAVLVTLLVERDFGRDACFEIEEIEQIKGIPKGRGKQGNLGYYDKLRIPIIENTAHEEDLRESLEEAMEKYPDSYAILVRRHGIYVWGDNVHKAKTQCESIDYILQLAVEMHKLGLKWTKIVSQRIHLRGRTENSGNPACERILSEETDLIRDILQGHVHGKFNAQDNSVYGIRKAYKDVSRNVLVDDPSMIEIMILDTYKVPRSAFISTLALLDKYNLKEDPTIQSASSFGGDYLSHAILNTSKQTAMITTQE